MAIVSWEYYSSLYDTIKENEFAQAEAKAEQAVRSVIGPLRWATMGKLQRQSAVTTENTFCLFCGRMKTEDHHLIFGNSCRGWCDRDKLTIPICSNCHTMGVHRLHDNPIAERLSKIAGQAIWERKCVAAGATEDEARQKFIERYGQSWM